MPDVYASIADAPVETVAFLIERLEKRARIPKQQEMLQSYLSRIAVPPNARILEVGCGSGAICRTIAKFPNVGEVTGIDPSLVFVECARDRAQGLHNLTFEVADAAKLPFADSTYDVVIFHTTLCHLKEPDLALMEAKRVLKSGGSLAVFDGDYSTMSASISANDPLEKCVDAARATLVHDPWIARRLPEMAVRAGFATKCFLSFDYVETTEGLLMSGYVTAGADFLLSEGTISSDLAAALKAEVRHRTEMGTFFGRVTYVALVALNQ